MKGRAGRMNDKRRLKRASDPFVLLPTEGTGNSIFLFVFLSLSLSLVFFLSLSRLWNFIC